MHFPFHTLALSGLITPAIANNHSFVHDLLLRQTVDCTPLFLEYPVDTDVPCGGDSYYVMPVCSCCSDGSMGCYGATDVCSSDAYGNTICCPADNPDCGEVDDGGSAATTTAPAESAPTTTYADPGSAATSTQNDDSAAATTPADDSPSSDGASTLDLGRMKLLVVVTLLVLV